MSMHIVPQRRTSMGMRMLKGHMSQTTVPKLIATPIKALAEILASNLSKSQPRTDLNDNFLIIATLPTDIITINMGNVLTPWCKCCKKCSV